MNDIDPVARAQVVGASEVAALFHESPFLTYYKLWMIKAGRVEADDLSDNERVQAGNFLEDGIAKWVSHKTGWQIRNVRRHQKHKKVDGFGASLDRSIVAFDERGPGPLELKNVAWDQYKDWPDGEPPLYYELQNQHQMAVTGWNWGAIGACVGGNEMKIFEYARNDKVIAKLEAAVTAFWKSIREGREPTPDFGKDKKTISELYAGVGPLKLDLTHDNRMHELCQIYKDKQSIEKAAAKEKDAAQTEIMHKIIQASEAGDEVEAKVFVGDDFTISTGITAASEVSYTRKAYRRCTINQRKSS